MSRSLVIVFIKIGQVVTFPYKESEDSSKSLIVWLTDLHDSI
jgi:hypothetical protein